MKTFEYKGYHFTPERKLPASMTFEQIARKQVSHNSLNLHNYEGGNGRSYEDFYKSSTEKEYGLFRCEETGLMYIPGLNELFLYDEKRR